MTDFIDTPIGPIPRIATVANRRDLWGTVGARIGIIRSHYRVSPGVYAVGAPSADAPILVTANYKLSFDALRFQLTGIHAWVLVVDTRGINVWCAAGKRTFSTQEVIASVKRYRLDELVLHRELILPQLAATGVSSQAVKHGCGWTVQFGPIRSTDLPAYLQHGKTATPAMREVTFTLKERLVLIPVELFLIGKPLLLLLPVGFLLSGIGPGIFSLHMAWQRGLLVLAATITGIVSGSILTPLLLPWLPSRQFWLKGLLAALPVLVWVEHILPIPSPLGQGALALWLLTISSFWAMNFTGSTPFTSPSGVEREMRRALPAQCLGGLTATICWVASSF